MADSKKTSLEAQLDALGINSDCAGFSGVFREKIHLDVCSPRCFGSVIRFDGSIAVVRGIKVIWGTICRIICDDKLEAYAEVIGFREQDVILAWIEGTKRIFPGARVESVGLVDDVLVGDGLLGRVLDADGKPLDGQGAVDVCEHVALMGVASNPLERGEIVEPVSIGVRAIDALVPLGLGQRIGIIAGSGVGKSVLLSMMCSFTNADVVIAGLIGERAREVSRFVEHVITPETRQRTIVVATTADRSPILRIRAAHRVAAYAEYFAAKGKNVLLVLDSLTRVGHAQREIGLALGEQPTARGYPPSVLALLPGLIERAGRNLVSGGSVTALYTILADGDDHNDPIVDTARAITDGHIVLSRKLAEQGVYPAIDIMASISRSVIDITNKEHQKAMKKFRRFYTLYEENRDLFFMGGYQKGQDPEIDFALEKYPMLLQLIQQNPDECIQGSESIKQLKDLVL
jgi:flagellum-specific ATP synthase